MTDPVYVPIPEDQHDEDPVSMAPEYHGASATHLPIPLEDPDEVVAERQPSSSRQPVFVPGGRDGVFSNMSAKPEVAGPNSQTPGKVYEDIEPPHYSDVVVENESAPPYLESTILTNLMETGDVVIEGMCFFCLSFDTICFACVETSVCCFLSGLSLL